MKRKTIVVIGGGTGTSVVLNALRDSHYNLNSIVSMADSGGSTGVLRKELGVLPPGDLRNALVSLSQKRETLKSIFSYRFEQGGLKGHNLGNLIISALSLYQGGLKQALQELHELLNVQGKVLPVTYDNVNLHATCESGSIIYGEGKIYTHDFSSDPLKELILKPKAHINPDAKTLLEQADLIIIGPGDLFCSIIPNLLVHGVKEALAESKAKKIFMVNLLNKARQNDGYTVSDYANTLEQYVGANIIDIGVYNKTPLPQGITKSELEGTPVLYDPQIKTLIKLQGYDLVSQEKQTSLQDKSFPRTIVRHDAKALKHLVDELMEKL